MSEQNGADEPPVNHAPHLVGDGYDPEPLLTVDEVAERLNCPTDAVYKLPLPQVKVSERRTRWRPRDVEDWIRMRMQGADQFRRMRDRLLD